MIEFILTADDLMFAVNPNTPAFSLSGSILDYIRIGGPIHYDASGEQLHFLTESNQLEFEQDDNTVHYISNSLEI